MYKENTESLHCCENICNNFDINQVFGMSQTISAHQSQTKDFRKTFCQISLWPHQLHLTKIFCLRLVELGTRK